MENYDENERERDNVYIFRSSQSAHIARSLAGLTTHRGLLRPGGGFRGCFCGFAEVMRALWAPDPGSCRCRY